MTRKSLEQKRKEAEERKRRYQSLTLEQRLEKALANGHSESREVKRLLKQIEQRQKNQK